MECTGQLSKTNGPVLRPFCVASMATLPRASTIARLPPTSHESAVKCESKSVAFDDVVVCEFATAGGFLAPSAPSRSLQQFVQAHRRCECSLPGCRSDGSVPN